MPTENPVAGNGVYLPEAKVFVGEHIYKAQPKNYRNAQNQWAFARYDVITQLSALLATQKRRLFSVQRPNGLSTWKAKVCGTGVDRYSKGGMDAAGDKIASNR
ncbi:MAG: hypothetical protein U1E92_03795 [Moraxella osloensis]